MKSSVLPFACALVFLPATPGFSQEVAAGKTTTSAPGTKAKVTSRQKGDKTLFDFVIPRGKAGAAGATGAAGPVGPVGPVGPAGPAATAASKARSIYIPGAGLSYTGTGVTAGDWGPILTAAASAKPAFVLPRPADWDDTTAPSVTIYFSIATTGGTDSTVRWRLHAGSNSINSDSGNAATGWDSLGYTQTLDAPALLVPVATPYTNVAKSQTWTALYSNQFNSWYFGTGVTTNNRFSSSPLWHFAFQRGNSISNGESFTGSIAINGISVNYTAK